MLYHIWNVCSITGMIMLILLVPASWIWPNRIRTFMQTHPRVNMFMAVLSMVGFTRAALSVHHIV